ncbi:MAG: phage integrase N-terminal domain-containing protein [Pseudomonadota bacterium]
MRDLNYDLKRLGDRNRDGSYATQANRSRMLGQMADQLHELGYKHLRAPELKGRHVNALVERWQEDGLSAATIKNRMAALRWWAEKVGRASVVARENAHYGIPDRAYVAQRSKAQELPLEALVRVEDPHVRVSLQLQAAFGLRREEAIKLQPSAADQADRLVLKASWTKGGRPRELPIRTEVQRAALGAAHALAGKGSLIPGERTYIQQLKIYERHTARAGLSKLHGLRHAYAQDRYGELTGWPAPAAGGPPSRELSAEDREVDRQARLTVSRELGHEREQITTVYLGR